MKKISKTKSSSSIKGTSKPDVAGFMTMIQEQLLALSAKMDALMGGQAPAPVKPLEIKAPAPQSVQRSEPSQQPAGSRSGQGRRERILHKTVCADCHKDCEVPFKPTGERPVYCKECFSKRKAAPKQASQTQPLPPRQPQQHQHSPRVIPQSAPVQKPQAPVVPVPEKVSPSVQRHVTVTKKGVGKVTVSEVIAPSRAPSQPRPASTKEREVVPPKKGQRPPQKPRR